MPTLQKLKQALQDLNQSFKSGLNQDYLRQLNHLIIKNNISDKTILAYGNTASWNMGCGSRWVEKIRDVKTSENFRPRGTNGISSLPHFSEKERLELCACVIYSLEERGFTTILLQEGPSNRYLELNPEIKYIPKQFGLKKEEVSEYSKHVWCYTKIQPQEGKKVRVAQDRQEPEDSPQVKAIKEAAQQANLKENEFQLVIVTEEECTEKIYVNIHFDYGKMYVPLNFQEMAGRIEFLAIAKENAELLAGDTNIKNNAFAKVIARGHLSSGIFQLNGGCQTMDILIGKNIHSLETQPRTPDPFVYQEEF